MRSYRRADFSIHYYEACITETYLRLQTAEGIAAFIKSNHRHLERSINDVVYAICKEFLGLLPKLSYHSLLHISSSMKVCHFRTCFNSPEARKCYDNPDLCTGCLTVWLQNLMLSVLCKRWGLKWPPFTLNVHG